MSMKGLGKGFTEEAKRQAKAINNATRYLTGEAREGAIGLSSSDNRRTYNQTSTVNLNVASMQIRDKQDIQSLAVEIATIARQRQRGKGLKMA